MQIPLYQIDAFTDHVFGGNPAAVCPLESWLPDATLQGIALENNLSETAFLVPGNGEADYHLRWFTPAREIDLCGHATLASAAVIFRDLRPDLDTVVFGSMSGPLVVRRDGKLIELDFPARPPVAELPVTGEIMAALGAQPETVYQARELHAVFADANAVRTLTPDFDAIAGLESGAIVATAPGADDETDYVCRSFFPGFGVPEDPVTGSVQCTLAPIWASRLGTNAFQVRQLSARGGDLRVTLDHDRVRIAGEAVFVLQGRFTLPD